MTPIVGFLMGEEGETQTEELTSRSDLVKVPDLVEAPDSDPNFKDAGMSRAEFESLLRGGIMGVFQKMGSGFQPKPTPENLATIERADRVLSQYEPPEPEKP